MKQREDTIVDITNASIKTDNPKKVGDQINIMKIRGKLAQILVDIAPKVHGHYITYENGKAVVYLELLESLYGTLIASLLFYKKLRKDLEAISFKLNPYDPCVANKMIRNTKDGN